MASRPELSPIALFAYMRPDHLRLTVQSLQANAEATHSDLHVFCDAPKRAEHADAVQAVRRFADSITGFASVTVVKREANLGLARSIIDGVTRLTAQHGRVIVVEDDLLLSPHFLRYMNDGLACYADDAQVASLHGYCYPVVEPLPETFLLRGADCWGWATWARAWTHFNPDGAALLVQLGERRLARAFDLDGSYPFTRMLRHQVQGRNDSWAVRWHASCFLDGLLTVYPGRSLVHNIGNDDSGTHCDARDDYRQLVAEAPVSVQRLPLTESAVGRDAFIRFFRQSRPSMLALLGRVARRWLKDLR